MTANTIFTNLLALKSSVLLSDTGGRKLYSVKITPAFRAKHFTLWVRSLSNASFELKEKSAITGDANDSGYILIDKREQNIARGFNA